MVAENPRRGKGPPSDDGQEMEAESTRRQGDRMLKTSLRGVEARPPQINETARMARVRGRVGTRTHRPGSGHHQASGQDAIAVQRGHGI